jgi:quercetin dioxygenase-like cupin family protein
MAPRFLSTAGGPSSVDMKTSSSVPSQSGTKDGIRRRLRSAPRVRLPGRSARVLVSPQDGVGDITVTVARIAPGRMNAHIHGPGGEAMYVAGGRGDLWVEGLPIPLREGTSAFAPPGVLHNAENFGARDLIVVGMFCPGAVPGSYAEQAPQFAPTGRLQLVDGLAREAGATSRANNQEELFVQRLIEDSALSPNIAMSRIRVPRGSRITRPPSRRTHAWVVLDGSGEVIAPTSIAGEVRRFDVVALPPGRALTLVARDRPLTLLEFAAHPEGREA